ncbi:MAG: hypothetical protein QM690_19525 [Sphingobium sp.]
MGDNCKRFQVDMFVEQETAPASNPSLLSLSFEERAAKGRGTDKGDPLSEGPRFVRAIFIGLALSLPLWALVIALLVIWFS